MKLYQYNIYTPETFNASGKAKKDVAEILRKMGIDDIYKPSSHRPIRILQQAIATAKPRSSTGVIIQYPAVVDTFIKKLRRKKNIKLIGIVHDLQSVRKVRTAESEIEILNDFDYIISHNPSMTAFLKENGYKGKIVDLGIFDYLLDVNRPVRENRFSNQVCFAGNLDKSEFFHDIGDISGLKFLLYGVNKTHEIDKLPNVEYKGMLPSDEIPYELEGSFGLVWDGETSKTCDGVLGQYLKYNNPHKLSLYMCSERPAIVWSKSAVAPFVTENGVGFAVDSLADAEKIISGMDTATFEKYLANVRRVKADLACGKYMTEAVQKVIDMLGD